MPVHFPWKMGGWWDLGQLLPCLWHCLSAWCICIISATVHHHKSGTAFPSKFQGKIALLGLCPPGQPAPRHLAALACLAPGAVSVGDSREAGWTLVLDLTSWMSICIFRSRSQLVGCLRPPHSLFKGPSAAGGRVPGTAPGSRRREGCPPPPAQGDAPAGDGSGGIAVCREGTLLRVLLSHPGAPRQPMRGAFGFGEGALLSSSENLHFVPVFFFR